ncbi:jacalin-related lectin 2-like [Hevea brasiliensis]|uniref:jacalin-related lectin 2-like n=1 Tax=Hevea brasiliensis TaxID=3981 RepID=UPI0025DF9415|nr:jacalin-related lectin 2-like [Hevea brasiliensis]
MRRAMVKSPKFSFLIMKIVLVAFNFSVFKMALWCFLLHMVHLTAPIFTLLNSITHQEFLVKVSGKYTIYGVRFITFTTNKGTYGPYGNVEPPFGTRLCEFNFDMGNRRQFGGFHGSFATQGLTSIGVYINPATTPETSPAEISNSVSDIPKTGNCEKAKFSCSCCIVNIFKKIIKILD